MIRSYDDDLHLLALSALESLALRPLNNRCNLDINNHTTVIHKTIAYFNPLFELVETTHLASTISIAQLLSTDFVLDDDVFHVKVDLTSRSKYSQSSRGSETNADLSTVVARNDNLASPDSAFDIPDIRADGRSLYSIIQASVASGVHSSCRFTLMCAVRMKRFLASQHTRHLFLRTQYQATSILLGCHPESVVLFNFFQDKIDLIKEFIMLLRTGPGSSEYRPDPVVLELRKLACRCIEAVLGSRDSTVTPIFVRYPWLLHDLGVNKGK